MAVIDLSDVLDLARELESGASEALISRAAAVRHEAWGNVVS